MPPAAPIIASPTLLHSGAVKHSPAFRPAASKARATAAAACITVSLPQPGPETTIGRSARMSVPAICSASARDSAGRSGTAGEPGLIACATANPSRAASSGECGSGARGDVAKAGLASARR